MAFYERQPYIQPLHLTVLEVMAGDIHVPRFQRPGSEMTWTPEQRQELLDSLYRGYPIGTILLWTTNMPLSAYERVGGFKVPPPVAGKTIRFLLDGHQRLSSLVQIFGRGLLPDLPENHSEPNVAAIEQWVFDVVPTEPTGKSIERFILLLNDQSPTEYQLPLEIVFNRALLNRWVREKGLNEEQTKEVDQLRDRMREYSMPVAILRVDTLEEVTESFKRINSSGTPMGSFNMLAALAYQPDFDLHERFDQAYDDFLTPIGWGGIAKTDVLRICCGVLGEEPTRVKVDSLADKLKRDSTLLDNIFEAIAKAGEILRVIGIQGVEILPYAWQLIIISVVLNESQSNSSCDIAKIEKWFWLTTYGEVFSGGNKTITYRRSKDALSELLTKGTTNPYIKRPVGQLPDKGFNFRAVRAKACLLAMARLQDGGDRNGPAHHALARGNDSLKLLPRRGGARSNWMNLVIVGENQSLNQFRDALSHRVDKPEIFDAEADDLLQKIGIPRDARGTEEALLQARRDFILTKEKEFVTELGLTWKDQNS